MGRSLTAPLTRRKEVSVPLTLQSPYSSDPLPWMRGNLHTHTRNSDGNLSPQATVDAYAALGYKFLMISDHDHFTNPIDLDPRGMLLIPGNEITAYGPHLLHVNAHRFIGPDSDRQGLINAINADGGFCIVNHPNWQESYNHCDQRYLDTWQDYAGLEIYNGVCRRAEGSPLATERWDRLLSAGRRVWGHGVDDSHQDCDRGVAWDVVQAESPTTASVVRALREGRFYASTGVVIDRIRTEGKTLRIDTQNAQRHYLCTEFSRVLAIADGPSFSYTVPDDFAYRYLRIECWGAGDAMAWMQPFFISRTEE